MNIALTAEQTIETPAESLPTSAVLMDLNDLEITLVGGGTGAVIFP